MSFNFETSGFLRPQRNADGTFDGGDVLPEHLTDELRDTVETQNPGSGELAADAYSHARDVAHGIGDPDTSKFVIRVAGHFNRGEGDASSKTYVQMGINAQ